MNVLKNMKTIITIIISALLFSSCTNEKCSTCPSQLPDVEMKSVLFQGEYSAMTKNSSNNIPAGISATIYAYPSGASPITSMSYPGTPVTASADEQGYFRIEGGLFMPNGTYDYYAVSTNSLSQNMQITKGVANSLSNGVDYLYAQAKNILLEQNTNILLQYRHQCSAVELTINSGDGVEGMIVRSIRIGQPSTQYATMDLSSGIIRQIDQLDPIMANMSINNKTGKYIMLPSSISVLPIEVYIDAIIAGVAVRNKKFTASLPSPSEGYIGGKIYKYNASLSITGVDFSTSTVESWVEQIINIQLN